MARKGSRRPSARRRETAGDATYNPVLQAAILEVVDTQLREGTPRQTGQTLDRLIAAGYPEAEARRLIGCVVVSEIFAVLQRHEPYDEARYVGALERLPRLPWEAP